MPHDPLMPHDPRSSVQLSPRDLDALLVHRRRLRGCEAPAGRRHLPRAIGSRGLAIRAPLGQARLSRHRALEQHGVNRLRLTTACRDELVGHSVSTPLNCSRRERRRRRRTSRTRCGSTTCGSRCGNPLRNSMSRYQHGRSNALRSRAARGQIPIRAVSTVPEVLP
jgi:hypothetical protein